LEFYIYEKLVGHCKKCIFKKFGLKRLIENFKKIHAFMFVFLEDSTNTEQIKQKLAIFPTSRNLQSINQLHLEKKPMILILWAHVQNKDFTILENYWLVCIILIDDIVSWFSNLDSLCWI